MPLPLIPLILGGIAAITTGKGVKSGFDAMRNINEAKDINDTAQYIAKQAERCIEIRKDKTKGAIESLGHEKIKLLTTSIKDFVINFEQIKNVNLKNSKGIDELKYFNPSSKSFKQLKKASFEAKEIAINGLAAIGSGALLAYGTYSVVMSGLGGLIVTATTGTALKTLYGAAAVNATLAWLGGGALSIGGLGMAGGMAVLGGLAFGPALAVGGSMFASQSRKALNDAYSNYDKAKAFKAQSENICIALDAIFTRANQLTEILEKLDSYFVKYVDKMNNIINRCGIDWNNYGLSAKQDIYVCVQLAQAIKTVLDTSLLKENGKLEETTKRVIENGNKYLRMMSQPDKRNENIFLSLEDKRNIFKSFTELTEIINKNGKIAYNFEGSKQRRKQIARELTHTGNGYIYGELLPEYQHLVDDRGWINIRDFSESELREIIDKVIRSFS